MARGALLVVVALITYLIPLVAVFVGTLNQLHVPVALEVELGTGPGSSEIEVVLEEANRRLWGRVLDLDGFPGYRIVAHTVLHHDDPKAVNDAAHPERVAPVQVPVPAASGGNTSV